MIRSKLHVHESINTLTSFSLLSLSVCRIFGEGLALCPGNCGGISDAIAATSSTGKAASGASSEMVEREKDEILVQLSYKSGKVSQFL